MPILPKVTVADMQADAEAHRIVAAGRARLVGGLDVVDQPARGRRCALPVTIGRNSASSAGK